MSKKTGTNISEKNLDASDIQLQKLPKNNNRNNKSYTVPIFHTTVN